MRRRTLRSRQPLPQQRTRTRSLLAVAMTVGALALPLGMAGAQLSIAYQAMTTEMVDPARCAVACFEVTHAYTAPPYISRDVERTTTLLYRSNRAKPMVTVSLHARHPGAPPGSKFLIQAYRVVDMALMNWTHGTTNLYFTPKNGGNDWTLLTGQLDASAWGTGRHSMVVIVSTIDANDTQIAYQNASFGAIVVDGRNSPFGAGFDLVGYQRLYPRTGGYLVTDGSGAASFFGANDICMNPWTTCTFGPPRGDFSTLKVNGTGYYIRSYPDGTVIRFDANGLMVDATDRFGSRTTYGHRWNSYYGGYVLEGITDPAGAYTWFYYWEPNPYGWKAGYIAEIHAPGGRKTVYAPRADNGNLDHYRDPNWNMVDSLHYDGEHRLTGFRDANGGVWTYEYGANNSSVARVLGPWVTVKGQAVRPQQRFGRQGERIFQYQVSLGGSIWTWPVNPNMDPRAFVTSPNGDTTHLYILADYGQANSVQDPAGGVSTAQYDAAGRLTRTQSPTGHVTKYTWEASRLRQVQDSTIVGYNPATGMNEARTIKIDYDTQFDQPTRIYGHTTEQCFEYDATKVGRPLKYSRIGSCTAAATTHVLTADGRPWEVTDPSGHKTIYGYEITGFLNSTSITAPGSRKTSYVRDQFGRVTRVTDPKNYSTTTQFDLLNQVQLTVGPANDTTRFEYTATGHVRKVTDAKGQYYEYQRNVLGWVEAQLDATPSHVPERFTYDSAGNVLTRTNRRNQIVSFEYDRMGRVKKRVQDPVDGSAQTTYAYDPAGWWVAATNPEGTDTVRFDRAGRVDQQIAVRSGLPDRGLTSYYQDPWGERYRVCLWRASAPGGSRMCDTNLYFEYDAARRLWRMSDPSGSYTKVAVNGDELPSPVTFPSGMTQTTTFSSIHGQSTTDYSVLGVKQSFYRSYQEDQAGLVWRKQHYGNRQRDFSYDSRGQIQGYSDYETSWEQECYTNEWGEPVCDWYPVNNVLDSESFFYDRVGNRTDNGASIGDPANRLSSFAGYSLSYDADGNLTGKSNGSVTWAYDWNSLGQLVRVRQNGVEVAKFGYDGFGRRVRKWTNAAGTTYYLWDGDQLAVEFDGGGIPKVTYTYYPGLDQLHSVTTGGQTYYAATERPGDVIGLIRRSDNAVVAQYAYRPFGAVRQDNTTIANSFRWQGLQYDRETGLYYVRSRYYDPELTRYVSEDPIGLEGGINLYSFAGNDPVNKRDPFGLEGDCYALVYYTYDKRTGEILSWMVIGYVGECDQGGGGGPANQSPTPTQQPQRLVCPAYLQNPTLRQFADDLWRFAFRSGKEQGGFFVSNGKGGVAYVGTPAGTATQIHVPPQPPGTLAHIHAHIKWGRYSHGPVTGEWSQAPGPDDLRISNTRPLPIIVVSKDSIFSHAPNGPVRGCAR